MPFYSEDRQGVHNTESNSSENKKFQAAIAVKSPGAMHSPKAAKSRKQFRPRV